MLIWFFIRDIFCYLMWSVTYRKVRESVIFTKILNEKKESEGTNRGIFMLWCMQNIRECHKWDGSEWSRWFKRFKTGCYIGLSLISYDLSSIRRIFVQNFKLFPALNLKLNETICEMNNRTAKHFQGFIIEKHSKLRIKFYS